MGKYMLNAGGLFLAQNTNLQKGLLIGHNGTNGFVTAQDLNAADGTNLILQQSSDGAHHVLIGNTTDLGILTYSQTGTAETNALGVGHGTASVQTTDNTETTCGSISTSTDYSYAVTCTFHGNQDDQTNSCMFVMSALFRNKDGTLTQAETAVDHFVKTSLDDGTACAADIDSSGTTIRFRVTGVTAETWEWQTNWMINVIGP